MKTFLLFFLMCSHVLAQSRSTSRNTPATTTSQATLSPFSLEFLKTNFKINYFSETLGSSIKKWDDNEIADDGSKLRQPMTMYHSFNVRYLLTQNFNLFMSPRFSSVIGDRNDLRQNENSHVLQMDDWQFGVFNTFYKSLNFQYNQRFTHRAPFSTKSKNENINSQIEWQHDLTYAVTPALRIIHWNNYRYYAFNNQSTEERYRINFTTLINYEINDKWKTQLIHEWDLQHRNPTDENSPQYREFNYLARNKNYFSFGVGFAPIPEISFIPFIRMLDERNIRNETMMVGLWVLGKVI